MLTKIMLDLWVLGGILRIENGMHQIITLDTKHYLISMLNFFQNSRQNILIIIMQSDVLFEIL